MARPEQKSLSLSEGLQASYGTATGRLMERIRQVDLHGAPKRSVLITELGIRSESHVSEALNAKGKNFPLAWLPAYVRYDAADTIAAEIASWKGLRVVPLRPQSTAERLARLERVLDRLGDTGDFIRTQAEALPEVPDE